jgi:ribokinase
MTVNHISYRQCKAYAGWYEATLDDQRSLEDVMAPTQQNDQRSGLHARSGRVLVIGSANVDVSVRTALLPRPGETVAGDSCVISVGGKGANQAAACALSGVPTDFVGRVGDDDFAHLVRMELDRCGVDHSRMSPLAGQSTGLAAIYVERSGQNCIVIVPGANAGLAPQDLDALGPLIGSAAILVLQCEIPLPTVLRAISMAHDSGTPVVLNPAPCRGLQLRDLPPGITYLVPNESEAAALAGMPVGNVAEAGICAARLQAGAIECVIITLGAGGCILADADGVRAYPAHAVEVVDTTGAGDAFTGCLAGSLAHGHRRDSAVQRALVYASLATTRRGALLSYAEAPEFERIWSALPAPGRRA